MTNAKIRRTFGWLGLVSMAVFIGNMLIGKYRIVTGTGIAAPLDGVPEFLILAISISFFVVWMIHSDMRGNK